jgi:hypothetical protein
VLADGLVVFNTESCTLEVVEAVSGKLLWEKWLGDPLLAQPAVMDGRVFMVYPKDGQHRLGAFTLKQGRPLWETRLDHDARLCVRWAEKLNLPWAADAEKAVGNRLGQSRWTARLKDGTTLVLNP